MRWQDRISSDPQVCHGSACIRGTRVMVSVLVDGVAAGEDPADVARSYQVTVDDVRAALHYAAELARERVAPLPTDAA